MIKLKQLKLKRKEDKAYLAGLIDGEGCLHLRKLTFRYKEKRYTGYGLLLQIAVTYKPILEWCKRTVGGGTLWKREDGRGKRRTLWSWKIEHSMAEQLLRVIYPYLKIKKEEADIVFQYRDLVNRHKQKRGYQKNGKFAGPSKDEIIEREELRKKLSKLKYKEYEK